ncbi:hypothetical protein KY285_030374 [Solanum tuberosum]|nr:hypothetical protein KY285_030374 [Solanum tuberosum]
MDKSWIGKPQTSNEYLLGLDKFLDFAFKNSAVEDTIRCPCPICHFSKWKTKVEVQDHLICKPFPHNYVTWNINGEKKVLEPSGDRVVTQETFHPENPIETVINDAFGQYRQQVVDVGTSQPLGSTGISNEGHREGSGDFHDFLKDGSETLYEGSKYTKLEFLIKLYHIKVYCRMTDKAMTMILDLLRDKFEDAKLPPFYEAKKTIKKLGLDYTKIPACPNNCMLFWEGDSELEVCKHCGTSKWSSNKKKKQAAKVLRYFPLKPMLKRLFMCSKTAEHMRWHASESNPDGLMRHPRDGEAWKTFDQIHSGFSSDPRNVRLGIATDGFNPFGTMSSTYSIWPVFLIPYNLPPWMCMKHTSFILSMIIPGKQTPGNNIDVYLQPLVKELRILSGWNTYTGFACPTYNFDTEPCRLHHGRGVELNGRRKRSRRATKQWNKRSIFFELPYWESNLLRHNLDFMHIEKNICDNIIYTLLDDKSKSKDNANARKDLREMRIRPDLWLKDDGSYNLVVFSLMTDNKKKVDTKKLFLTTLKNIKVPDGYSSNISRCVDLAQKKIYGLKSHDSHVLLEQLLPLEIRNVLPDHVVTVLVEFSSFFRALSSKTLNPSELDILQERFIITLCHLEMLFPPSFFTVMVHLSVHLVDEAKLRGPVHYRNMYPVERELGYCMPYVRNKSQPEGCIAEGHIAEKTLTFCSWYIEDIETRFNRPRCVRDEPTDMPSGMSSLFPQLEFREYIKRSSRGRRPSPTKIERRVNKEFVDWFQKRIMNQDTIDTMSIDLKFLARGPSVNARRFTAYNINGSKFRTLAREEGLKTQNSGVFLTSKTSCVASSVDGNLRQAELPYYGKLEDIIEINYNGRFKVVLFKCKWADTTRDRGYQKDRWNFNCVNFDRLIHTGEREEHEPYIEASQAQTVYYVDDIVNKGWSVVVHLKPRDLYDMGEVMEEQVYENEPYQEQELDQFFTDGDEYVQLATDYIIDDTVEANFATNLATDAMSD